MHAGVDGGVAAIVAVHFPYDRQARVEVGQAPWWQRGATGRELQEALSLVTTHLGHNIDEPLESRTEKHHRNCISNHTYLFASI